MITVKQVLENYNIITEKASNDTKNLAALVHAGLLDESKLPILNRALSKSANMMTEAEKKALQGLVESLASCVISEQQDHLSKLDTSRPMSYPSEKEIPTVLILKRKAIRVYPDNQKVALYYCQALDRYISVPYGKNAKNLGMVMNEDTRGVGGGSVSGPGTVLSRAQQQSDSEEKEKPATTATRSFKRKVPNPVQRFNRAAERLSATGADTTKNLTVTAIRAGVDPKKAVDAIAKERLSGAGTAFSVGHAIGRTIARNAAQKSPEAQKALASRMSFKNKLAEKRQEKIEEEGAWDATKAFAGNLASSATLGLSDTVGRRLSKNWDNERERLDKEHPTAATVGDVAGYAVPGVAAVKGAKLVYKGAKALAKTSIGKKVVDGIKNVGKLAGAAAIGAAAGGASGSDSDKPSFEKTSGADFSNLKKDSKISKPEQDPTLSSAGVGQQQRSAKIQSIAFKESTNNLTVMKQIVEQNIPSHTIYISETPITINKRVAKKVMTVYESLNRQNKKKIEKMLNEDAVSFKKVINFAIRQ